MDRFRSHRAVRILLNSVLCFGLLPPFASAAPGDLQSSNSRLLVTVRRQDGSYAVQEKTASAPVIEARVGAQIDHAWVKSSEYPKREFSETRFDNVLGHGHQIQVRFFGLAQRPDIYYALRLYDDLPYGDIQVEVRNSLSSAVHVQCIRVLEAVSASVLDLGGRQIADRILSDSFGENRPNLQIYDLGKSPDSQHRAVGSQLTYNRESRKSFFIGALTADRFLTLARLQTKDSSDGPEIASYEIDSTGTTEIQSRALFPDAPSEEDRIELSLPIPPGGQMNSERVMFALGDDYHGQLEAYGAAIRKLHHARVNSENLMGWWSWTAWYREITEGTILTNAQWLSEHLKSAGYNFFHIDSGYEYAPGEFTTPNASRFPHGMQLLSQNISRLGLKVGIWTAPFYVGENSWVAQHHKEWLVRNASGAPLRIMRKTIAQEGQDIFVLDTTHPGAQQYLRETYRTLVGEWGVRYIKLDFMDSTSIEGYHYRSDTTALEAQRIGLKIIRDAVGEEVLLDKDGSTMLNPVGIVDEGRISQDTAHSFHDTRASAPAIAARYYMHRNFFVSDPDAFNISREVFGHGTQRPMALNEAQVSIVLAAVSGGMFEIGDDLPTLGQDRDRLALVTNRDLLHMVQLSRAATPLDLMTYAPEDEMPSVFLLKEDARQSILALFNWTEKPSAHAFAAAELGVLDAEHIELYDALDNDRRLALDGQTIKFKDQPAHSVRLVKIVDASKPATPPALEFRSPKTAKVRESIEFSITRTNEDAPALAFHWDFGDGVHADGRTTSHTYTLAGHYFVKVSVDGVDGVPTERDSLVEIEGIQPIGPPQRYGEPNVGH